MKIRLEERTAVAFSFIYCFCILSAYYIMRPIRDQLAVEVGSAQLPWFFVATFGATLLLSPLFSLLVSRCPRRIVMPVVYLFFIVCQIIFILIWNDPHLLSIRRLGVIFFVWVSVFNLFVLSVFWSFMADIWNDEQARRLFPLIALGGTFGAIAGPFLTKILVGVIGVASLLALSIALLTIAIACILFLEKWAHQYGVNRNKKNNEAALGGGVLNGLKEIFTHPFIANMSLMMLLSDAIGTIAYVLITDYSGVAFPHDAVSQTQFAANMDLSANILQIILQLTITRWLLVRYGAGFVIAISAAIVGLASLAMSISQSPYETVLGIFPIVAIVLIITRSVSHSLVQSARESLYTLVPRDLRYKGKNAVDTIVWRAGDVISLSSIHIFRTLGVNASGFGLIWAFLAGVSGFIGWRLANRTEKKEFDTDQTILMQ